MFSSQYEHEAVEVGFAVVVVLVVLTVKRLYAGAVFVFRAEYVTNE